MQLFLRKQTKKGIHTRLEPDWGDRVEAIVDFKAEVKNVVASTGLVFPFPNSNYSDLLGPEYFEHPTLTDVLESYDLSWRYYAADAGAAETAPNAIAHMCQPVGDPNSNTYGGSDWTGSNLKVVIEGSGKQIITDIQSNKLAAVTWVIPSPETPIRQARRTTVHRGSPQS